MNKHPLASYLAISALLTASPPALAHYGASHVDDEPPIELIEHDWRPAAQIRRVFSTNFDAQGGNAFVSWSAPGRVEDREGRKCLVGGYFLFDIDNGFAFDIDEPVEVDLTFYHPETSGFHISYDQAIEPVAKTVHLDETAASARFQTITVKLDRARFANRKLYGADLGIGALGSTLAHKGASSLTLCDMRIRRTKASAPTPETGRFKLRILDENGQPTAARVGLFRPDGWAPLASQSALPLQYHTSVIRDLPMTASVPQKWDKKGRYVYFVSGDYQSDVPEGEYNLMVMKGPEYHIQSVPVQISRNKGAEITVRLTRWTDLPGQGWLSGDNHIHLSRPTPAANEMVMNFMKAEDVHVANILQITNLTRGTFTQYAFGKSGQYAHGDYMIIPGQESPRTTQRGHTVGLNAKDFYEDKENYFVYDHVANKIRADGGMWGYAHLATDMFGAGYGLALDVPRGKVDFFEILQWGAMNTSYLYDFLNMGFRMLPSAGSDYPCIDFPGAERLYVKVDKSRTAQSWFDQWQTGRSYVSNWLTARYSVNGDTTSSEFDVPSGKAVSIDAEIAANPDFDTVTRIELVSHGKVMESIDLPQGAETGRLSYSFVPAGSTWVAIRAYGKVRGLLHTAPVYIYVDGNKDFSDQSTRGSLAQKYIGYLDRLEEMTPRVEDEWNRWSDEKYLLPMWDAAKPQIDKLIEDARSVYRDLIKAAAQSESR